VSIEVKKSSDLKANLRQTILSIGDSRTGKTHFIGTMCEHEKVLVINAEDGLATIADKQFDAIKVNSFAQFKEALNWYMSVGHKDYTMLSIDSLNRVQSYLQYELDADGKLSQNQWGEVLATMRKFIDVLSKQCPTSLHITSMAMESKDELTGQIRIYPNIQGSFKYDLTGYFDTVLFHTCAPDKDGSTKYWCQIQGDSRVIAGSRHQALKGMKNIPADYGFIKSKVGG